MTDSNLYQHLVSIESAHDIFSSHNPWISSLSAISDDSYDNIDGGLQRALVIMFTERNNGRGDDELDNKSNNTSSFESWMASYKQQPQQLMHKDKRKRIKRKLVRSQQILSDNINNDKLQSLRNGLPFNPDKLRQIIKHQEILQNDTNTKKMKLKLKNWKNFKLNWMDWRLIDFYEYLIRINNRKYYKYIFDFDLFRSKWMKIYQNDQDSSSRFISYVFNGRMLIYLDHNDLVLFGIHLKEDRREILMRIQRLNGFRNCN